MHRSSKINYVKTASLTLPTSNETLLNGSFGTEEDTATENMCDRNSTPRKCSCTVKIVLPNDMLSMNQTKEEDKPETKPNRVPSVFALNAKRNTALVNSFNLEKLSYGKIEAVNSGSLQV